MNTWQSVGVTRDNDEDRATVGSGTRADVGFVIGSILRPQELAEWDVRWLRSDDHPSASYHQEGFLPEDGSEVLWVKLVAEDGEEWWYGNWHPRAEDWRAFLARFSDELSAWISESSFGWGEWRQGSLPPESG